MSVSVGYPGRQVAPACATVRQADYSPKLNVDFGRGGEKEDRNLRKLEHFLFYC